MIKFKQLLQMQINNKMYVMTTIYLSLSDILQIQRARWYGFYYSKTTCPISTMPKGTANQQPSTSFVYLYSQLNNNKKLFYTT